MKKQWMFYVLAMVITLSAAIYQRLTGPTHPKRVELEHYDTTYKVQLPRSSDNDADCKVILVSELPAEAIPVLLWRHYPTNEEWEVASFSQTDEGWVAILPRQEAAGKLEYFIRYHSGSGVVKVPEDMSVVIRFKGPVPAWVLLPHVFFMFLAMYFSNLMGLEAIYKNKNYLKHAWIAAGLLAIGGFILGPLVQNFAFGDYWTGIPFGWDLTDNKTLMAGVGFVIGLWRNRKTGNPYWILFACIVMLAIYLIPHSAMGSELDYETGKVMTG